MNSLWPGLSAAKLTTTDDAKPGNTNEQRATAIGAASFAVSGAGPLVSHSASKPGGGSMY